MKRKLIALAIASVFVAPAAMADTGNVTLYGVMDASVDFTSTGSGTVAANGLGGAVNSANQTKVSSNASRLGFKGTEDLGGGTSAVFQIEQGVTADAPAATSAAGTAVGNTLATRNTFVGLTGESWGTLLLGNNDSPYKSSTRKMDMFGDTIADNRNLMGVSPSGIAFDGRNANSVTYSSPDLGGLKISLQYVAGAELAAVSTNVKGNAYSLSGVYAAGPLTGVLAYETHDMGTAATGTMGAVGAGVVSQKERAFKLAGGYAVDQFAVNLVYEKATDGFGAGGADVADHRSWYLGGKYILSATDAVKLGYTNRGTIGSVANTGSKQVSVGYDHAMSKRTTVYALYSKLSNDSATGATLGIAAASTGLVAAGSFDADPSAFAIGVKHSF